MSRFNSSTFSWDLPAEALVFISSFSLMVIELVAGRIMAEHLGGSLYSWTSVVGTALLGMALGGLFGGWLADRRGEEGAKGGKGGNGEEGILWVLFFISSLLALSTVPMILVVGGEGPLVWMARPLRVLCGAPILYLAPAFLLSSIFPVAAKIALKSSSTQGSTAGRLYALGSIGSIVGTFLTGFCLISLFGTKTTLCLVGAFLALVSMALGGIRTYIYGLPWMSCVLVFALTFFQGDGIENPDGTFVKESNYYYMSIEPGDEPGLQTLYLDNLAHSLIYEGQPERLGYDYEQIFAAVTGRIAGKNRIRTLSLGGGGYVFPRYLEATYPGSQIEVVEIDPWVTRIAHERLGMPRQTSILSHHADARRFLDELPASDQFDVIYGDAFNSFSIPWHLTTRQFHDLIRAHLKPHGAYLANVIDIYEVSKFLGGYASTLQQTFPCVTIFSCKEANDEQTRDTFVVVSSLQPLDLTQLGQRSGEEEFNQFQLSPQQMATVLQRGGRAVFTDSFAPVDTLMASMLWADYENENAESE